MNVSNVGESDKMVDENSIPLGSNTQLQFKDMEGMKTFVEEAKTHVSIHWQMGSDSYPFNFEPNGDPLLTIAYLVTNTADLESSTLIETAFKN